ncbi:hypothetical protein N7540_013029 [Penicillium herquei]|nr:hypothetical protein N7540_013029 [Penicillium herquei]
MLVIKQEREQMTEQSSVDSTDPSMGDVASSRNSAGGTRIASTDRQACATVLMRIVKIRVTMKFVSFGSDSRMAVFGHSSKYMDICII